MNPSADHIEKLKASFGLAVGSNASTMAGVLGSFVLLLKTEAVPSFWTACWIAVTFLPLFVADAINGYVLSRIWIEVRQGWRDIQITAPVMATISRHYWLMRAPGLLTTIGAAGMLLVRSAPVTTDPRWLQACSSTFVIGLLLSLARSAWLFTAGMQPEIERFTNNRLAWRLGVITGGGGLWAWSMLAATATPADFWVRLGNGMAYIVLSALTNPLPSRFSIFRFDGVVNPRPIRAVTPAEVWPAEVVPPADIVAESEWLAQAGYTRVGLARMPLVELPIFAAAAEVWCSTDGDRLIMLQKSEVKAHWHRAVVSLHGEQTLMVTDFAAPNALFPAEIRYASLPNPTPVATLIDTWTHLRHTHADALGPMTPFANPPWDQLQSLCVRMGAFLKRGADRERAAGATPPPEAAAVAALPDPAPAMDPPDPGNTDAGPDGPR